MHKVLDFDGFFGTTYAKENGHEIWTWNDRCLHRLGSQKAVSSKMAKYNLDLVAVKMSGGLRVVVSQEMIIHFSMETEKLTIS